VEYPPNRSGLANGSNFAIALYADQVTAGGTPILYVDTLYFVPSSEGFYWGGRRTADYPNTSNTNGQNYYGYVGPNMIAEAFTSGTAGVPGSVDMWGMEQPYFRNGLPVGSGIGVFACDNVAESSFNHEANYLTWDCNIEIQAIERWESLRGAD